MPILPHTALNPFGHQKRKGPPVAKRKHEELTATDRRYALLAGEEDSNKMWKGAYIIIIPDKTLWEIGGSRAEMALERETLVLNTAVAYC